VKRLRQVSELHRPRRNVASHQEACGKAQLQARASLADLRARQSKVAVERPRFSAAERLQPAWVRVSVAAAQSEDSLATANLARRLQVLVPVKDKAEKNAGNPESIDLRPHRLPVQVRAKREVEKREGKVPMVNLPASQEVERLLQLSAGKGNRSAERKRARGPHRHKDHNRGFQPLLACSRLAVSEAFLAGNTATQRRGYSSSAICTAFSAAPLSN
jgi:hypothetical protein